MLQMILRILGILSSGGILFCCLLYFIGWKQDRYLRGKRTGLNKRKDKENIWVIFMYFILLCFGIFIDFIIINSWIRGVV